MDILRCILCGKTGGKRYAIPRPPNIETRCDEHAPKYLDTIESVMRELAESGYDVVVKIYDVALYPERKPTSLVSVKDYRKEQNFSINTDDPLAKLIEARDRLVKEVIPCFCRETNSTRRDCVEANMCLGHGIS